VVAVKRYHDAAEVLVPEAPTVGAAMSGLIGASLVIGVGGLALLVAVERLSWPNARVVLLVAALPWIVSGAVLVAAAWRRAWSVLENALQRDLDGNGDVGTTRLIPVNAAPPSVQVAGNNNPAIDPRDLADMLDQLDARGVAFRQWVGYALPSGWTIRGAEDRPYRALIDILERHGWLVDRGERRTGRLTRTGAEIRAALNEAGVL
jgi:hypothetical protein